MAFPMNKQIELLKENSRLIYSFINLYENVNDNEIKNYILEVLNLKDDKREEFKKKFLKQ